MHLHSYPFLRRNASRWIITALQGMYSASRGIFCISLSPLRYLNPSLILIDPDPLVLTLISRSYINLALNSLMDEPRAHIVLKHPTEDEVISPKTEAVRRSGREFFKNCIIPNKKVDCNKVKEGRYVKWRDVDVDANRIYGLPSQELLFTLLDYGQINGGYIPRLTQMRGSCLFHSIHKALNVQGSSPTPI